MKHFFIKCKNAVLDCWAYALAALLFLLFAAVVAFAAFDSFADAPSEDAPSEDATDTSESTKEETPLDKEQILALWQSLAETTDGQSDKLAALEKQMAALGASLLKEENAIAVYGDILPSCVSVLCYYEGQETMGYSGSGFFISTDGLVATAYHVIAGAERISIRTSDKKYHDVAYVAGYDVDLDVAILKVELANTQPVTINTATPTTGETLYALGKNSGVDFTYSTGILSTAGDVHTRYPKRRMLRYCNLTQKGDSGCAIFNAQGEAIGMCQFQESTYGTLQWALSISQVYDVPTDMHLSVAECAAREALDLTAYLDYEIRGGEAFVTGLYRELPTDVRTARIPAQIGGYPVVSLSLDGDVAMPNIRTLLLPDGIRTLGRAFLSNQSKITGVTIPASVMEIASDAFLGTPTLAVITSHSAALTVDKDSARSADGKTLYRVLSLPAGGTLSLAGVETVGAYAAYNQPVTALADTASLKKIDAYAFALTNLSAVILPDGTKEIGDGAFYSSRITLLRAEGLTVLGPRALSHCRSLVALWLGDDIRRIEKDALYGCIALRTLSLPEGLVYLGYGALGNTAITDVTLPASLAYIGDEAFVGTPLSRVTLASLPYLEALTAFGNPDALSRITFALPASLADAAEADRLYRALFAIGTRVLLP